MECKLPPPLTDEALSLVLDGEANQEIREHLSLCPSCTARLNQMKQFESSLRQRLKRFDCPSPQQLGDYQLGLLEADEAEAIQRHLEQCPRCKAELAMLIQFLEQASGDDTVGNKIIPLGLPKNVMRAERVQTSGSLALKGLDNETSHDVKAGSASVFLESKTVPNGFKLTGQVVDSQINWVGAVVEIWQGGQPRHIAILDDMCEFTYEFTHAEPITIYITAAGGTTLVVEEITT